MNNSVVDRDFIVEVTKTDEPDYFQAYRFRPEVSEIKIGRISESTEKKPDVPLPDAEAAISRTSHAVIVRGQGKLYVEHRGSNPTWLGQISENNSLQREKLYELKSGDRIFIKNYAILCTLAATNGKTPNRLSLKQQAAKTAATLEKLFEHDVEELTYEDREEIRNVLHETLQGLDGASAAELGVLLKADLAEHWKEIVELISKDDELRFKLIDWPLQEDLLLAAYEAMINLKHDLSGTIEVFALPSNFQAFAVRLESMTLEAMRLIVQQLKTRATVERNLQLEKTEILNLPPNAVKSLEDHQKLIEYLLDWRDEKKQKPARENFKRALADLGGHQISLLKAYNSSIPSFVKRLAAQLSTAGLKKKLKAEMRWPLGKFSISYGYWPFLQWRCRKERRKMIDELLAAPDKTLLDLYVQDLQDAYYDCLTEVHEPEDADTSSSSG